MKTTILVLTVLALTSVLPEPKQALNAPTLSTAMFHCTNHDPNDVARSPAEVKRLTEEKSCAGWTSVTAGQVAGSLRDDEGRPIPGVMVSLSDGVGTVLGRALTDGAGEFRMEEIPISGSYRAEVSMIGYGTYRAIVRVGDGPISLVIRGPSPPPTPEP